MTDKAPPSEIKAPPSMPYIASWRLFIPVFFKEASLKSREISLGDSSEIITFEKLQSYIAYISL
jgi:hypothetical protein